MSLAVSTEELPTHKAPEAEGPPTGKKKKYANWKRGTEPYFPNEVLFMAQVVLILLVVVFVFAFFFVGVVLPPDEMANPLVTPDHIKPEWYFLAAYRWLKTVPNEKIGIMSQILVITVALLLPFWDRGKERNTFKRPALLLLGFAALGLLGGLTAFSALK
jgi:quinol-cytochrome oxidoreductase complex cytochrome b subunit